MVETACLASADKNWKLESLVGRGVSCASGSNPCQLQTPRLSMSCVPDILENPAVRSPHFPRPVQLVLTLQTEPCTDSADGCHPLIAPVNPSPTPLPLFP